MSSTKVGFIARPQVVDVDQRVQKTLQLMRDNLHRDLPLPAIAHSVNLSVWRLCHVFKSEMDLSPIQYLRLLRMERAGTLLETSFLSVKEIAHAVGLNDESHFVRDFKIIFGVTPTHYRTLFVATQSNESTAVFDVRSKIRQRIAKTAKRSVLPSLNILIYMVTFLARGTEVLLEVGKPFQVAL